MHRQFERQYNEEAYLFEVVSRRFRKQGFLDDYDLMSIVRWKANRAISKVARTLVRVGGSDLKRAAHRLTSDLYNATSDRDRFLVATDKWKLRLPMASAILTVLFPECFTVYDVRACEILGGFGNVSGRKDPLARWQGYVEFKSAVEQNTPADLSLRDKDRYLWAKSRHESLKRFLARDFSD